MTKVYNFPTVPVSKQLFHVPGMAQEGGFTAGGVRLLSPEPGGRSVLELQIALQVREWDFPFASWIMSKGNGQVFKVRLAPTPQILGARAPGVPWAPEPGVLWAGDVPWSGDITAFYASDALEGSNVVRVNMTGYGDVARVGHVIGDGGTTYMIDEIGFDADTNIATMTVTPPLRRKIAANDAAYFRTYFTGTISNMSEVRNTYDAENNGAIQPGKIVFAESIL